MVFAMVTKIISQFVRKKKEEANQMEKQNSQRTQFNYIFTFGRRREDRKQNKMKLNENRSTNIE